MNKKYPYIKPINKYHRTGWKLFEVGYLEKENKRATNIEKLGCCDEVVFEEKVYDGNSIISLRMDCLANGYIRFYLSYPYGKDLCWESDFIHDTMKLKIKEYE